MKKTFRLLLVFGLATIFALNVQAQDEESSSWDMGLDLTSTYVWRGVAYSGPSIQPYVEYSSGIFTVGAWGSQGFDGFQEMDTYASLGFDFGLSLGVTDYYYPGTQYGDKTSHSFELNGGYEVGAFSLSGNYIFAGEGSVGDDLYFEAGLSLGKVDLFVGAGDGWHSTDGDFKLCNIGISTSKEVKITDSFSLPVAGSCIWNPDTEQFYIVGTISF
ncbi:TorF family putative porin [Mangrovibacterium lignilyticum]|uniref:TorF family putative porin n=1 Tax=Mangrovibacterium lignilyticum TaxID=2668052 RepID=UPI0013D7E51D|nr:TorF family putative porin [Mangrovibacterium lignilyticum]